MKNLKRVDGVIADLSPLKDDLVACGYACDAGMFDVFNETHMAAESTATSSEVLVYGRIVDDFTHAIYSMYGLPSITGSVFRERLSAVKGDAVIRINSPGGSVMEAAVMRRALQERGGSHVAVIDGSAASAASLVALTAPRVEMSDMGLIYVHQPVMHLEGSYYARELEEMAGDLDRMSPQLERVYDERGVDYGKLGFANAHELMLGKSGNGTSVTAKDALDSGMIDAVGVARPEPASSESSNLRKSNMKTAANVGLRNRMKAWLAEQQEMSS